VSAEDADASWSAAIRYGLAGLEVETRSANEYVAAGSGRSFVNMCSSAYLGLNSDPRLVQGAIDALERAGTTGITVSATRMRHRLAVELEDRLGELFGVQVLTAQSCSALSAGILPLIAAGQICGGRPRVMIFDENCHSSLKHARPLCAQHAPVLTCPASDVAFVEDVCRKHDAVAYVTDSVYAMGGTAPLQRLAELQDRYGLLLYLDDSHCLSVAGQNGRGYSWTHLPPNPFTLVVATLHKGFGAGGGIVMFDDPGLRGFLQRNAGPLAWSQGMDIPMIGAARASAEIHGSPELADRQDRLRQNVRHFDRLLKTRFAGNDLPIRMISVGGTSSAFEASALLLERGFYTSSVFFPLVAQGAAALRVMIRADMSEALIESFAGNAEEVRRGLAADRELSVPQAVFQGG
jgi:7-keto-8-aminopelargonate synthetase-like enzyme